MVAGSDVREKGNVAPEQRTTFLCGKASDEVRVVEEKQASVQSSCSTTIASGQLASSSSSSSVSSDDMCARNSS